MNIGINPVFGLKAKKKLSSTWRTENYQIKFLGSDNKIYRLHMRHGKIFNEKSTVKFNN